MAFGSNVPAVSRAIMGQEAVKNKKAQEEPTRYKLLSLEPIV